MLFFNLNSIILAYFRPKLNKVDLNIVTNYNCADLYTPDIE